MGLVGSNIFGREALAEIRVHAAQDLGDRRGETNISLLGNPGFAQSVRGGESGNDGAAAGSRTERADGNEENYLREGERGHPGRGCSVNGTYQLLLRFLVFARNKFGAKTRNRSSS